MFIVCLECNLNLFNTLIRRQQLCSSFWWIYLFIEPFSCIEFIEGIFHLVSQQFWNRSLRFLFSSERFARSTNITMSEYTFKTENNRIFSNVLEFFRQEEQLEWQTIDWPVLHRLLLTWYRKSLAYPGFWGGTRQQYTQGKRGSAFELTP